MPLELKILLIMLLVQSVAKMLECVGLSKYLWKTFRLIFHAELWQRLRFWNELEVFRKYFLDEKR